MKKFLEKLNLVSVCQKYYLPLWQCPHFIFLILGFLIIFSLILTYFLGNKFIQDPLVVAFLVLILSAILFVLSFLIVQSFEKLAYLNRLKSEFIEILSHQIRTPLSNIKWSLELLSSKKFDLSLKENDFFQIIKENSKLMEEIIKDLLIISRIESTTLPLKISKFSPQKLVGEIVEKFSFYTKAMNLKVELNIDPNLNEIFSDEEKLKIVIENLLENAIKYSKGKGKIKILLEKRGNNFYFEIEDEGVGIPKEDQKFIFQKFFRASNVKKIQPVGSGLGLYICSLILKKLKGKIDFKSEENKGSKFWFSIPLKI